MEAYEASATAVEHAGEAGTMSVANQTVGGVRVEQLHFEWEWPAQTEQLTWDF